MRVPRKQPPAASGTYRMTLPSGNILQLGDPSKEQLAQSKKKAGTTRKRRANVKQQPRDEVGKFARKGGFFSHIIPAKRGPAGAPQKLERLKPAQAPSAAKKKKTPYAERGFFGKLLGLVTGDYKTRSRRKVRH